MDGLGLSILPRLPRGSGSGRRVQLQIHVQPVCAEGRKLCHAPRACPGELPQLLLPAPTLAVHRRSSCKGYIMLLYQNDQSVCFAEVDPALRCDVLNGLASRPRTIPARWFYDRVGSELFE